MTGNEDVKALRKKGEPTAVDVAKRKLADAAEKLADAEKLAAEKIAAEKLAAAAKKRLAAAEHALTEFGRWYASSGLVATDIMKILECSKTHAYELIQGKKIPSVKVAVRLIHMSRARPGRKHLKIEDFLKPEDLPEDLPE